MLKIGLTGGIGCGKSTVTKAFHQKGIVIIDADKIARELVESNKDVLDEIVQTFGASILDKEGKLRRDALKKQIFSSDEKLNQLEKILHPRIQTAIELAIQQEADNKKHSAHYIIVDIPLLIEKDYSKLFDKIIVVDCLPEQQIQRVQQRDALDTHIIQSIIDKQIDRASRLRHADFILDNSKTQEHLKQQINSLHKRFIGLSR